MAQAGRGAGQRGSKVSSYSSSVGGGPPSHLLLMELKHRMLAALAKLSDRDTQQLAVDDLQKLIEVLSPEGLSMCLSCLYDTDTQQKSIVKKECVKMFATLAALHGPSLVPHLHKIVASIVRRLKDPDTGVRDACVDAMGSLSSNIVYLLPPPASKLGVVSWGMQTSDAQEPNVAHAPMRSNSSAHMPNMLNMQELNVAQALTCANSSSHMSNRQDPALAPPVPRPGLGGTHSSSMQELNAFVKPLFDALSEQNRSVQSGAAMCLARVITSARGNPHSPSMGRLCQRICKLLTNPSFLAKAALLPVIASLSQVGAVHNQNIISIMVPCVHDALESHDWATRKAAAETLTHMGSSLGTQLTTFKSGTLLLLESCRFDKVKPVRDSVQDAIQTWKSLPGLEREMPSSACSTPSANGSTGSCPNSSEKLPGILKKKGSALTDKKPNAEFFSKLETQSTDDWHIEVAVPRSCPPPSVVGFKESDHDVLSKNNANEHGDLISNEYISGKDSSMHDHGREIMEVHNESSDVEDEDIFRNGCSNREDDSHSSKRLIKAADHNVLKSWDDVDSNHNSQRVNNAISGERSLALCRASDSHPRPWDITSPPSLRSTSDNITSNGNSHLGNGGEAANWLLIQKQLSQLEFQQANIMDLFQEFMGTSRNSMFALEARIKVLERVVEDIAQDLEAPESDCLDRYNGEISEHVYNDSSKYLSSQREDHYNMQSSMTRNGRLSGHSSFTASASKTGADLMIREPTYDTSTSAWRSNADMGFGEEQWNETPSKSHLQLIEEDNCRLETHPSINQCCKDLSRADRMNARDDDSFSMINNVRNVDALGTKSGDMLRASDARDQNDVFRDQEQMAARRVWDTEPMNSSAAAGNHVRPGEGPSARSVWQASKDEATLAAIRGAREEEGEPNFSSSKQIVTQMEASHIQALDKVTKTGEIMQKPSSSTSSCSSSNVQIVNSKGTLELEGKRAYWRLWSRAMELVQVGNMDCAYMEVLGSGDELMLVRLMNKTGPVLEKLSSNTANEMLQNVAQLLRQHSFFDFSLPWVQQVADLIMDMGANSLDILSDVKRDLIHSIQEASHMEIPNDWLGNSINELCSILMDAWAAEQDIL